MRSLIIISLLSASAFALLPSESGDPRHGRSAEDNVVVPIKDVIDDSKAKGPKITEDENYPEFLPIVAELPKDSSPKVEFPVIRRARQVYYQCGKAPNFLYSRVPCNQILRCSNNDYKLGVGCSNAIQCTQYYTGPVRCESNCCCTADSAAGPSAPSQGNSGVCYHGQLSQVQCSARGQCAAGQSCMNGLCCTVTGNEYTAACGGLAANAACTNGGCNGGLFCAPSNYCCECPVGRTSGRCNNGACAAGYTCQPNGYCCASCPNNVAPYGACRNGVCGGGRTCCAGNICC